MNSDGRRSYLKLIARKLAGDATEEEVKELEDLLRTGRKLHFTIE